jgi:phosphoribosylaminoimidazole carboxylase
MSSGPDTSLSESSRAVIDSASSVPGARVHWYPKYSSNAPDNSQGRRICLGHINISACTMHELQQRTVKVLESDADCDKEVILSTFFDSADPVARARVALVLSADSDTSCMAEAVAILEEFQVSYSSTIISAHRTPTRMFQFATQAVERGTQCIIVAAGGVGGSSALPGMVASLTALPVIGVPMKSNPFNRPDTLLCMPPSLADMPRGVPVATVGIGAAANAALLAVRILGTKDPQLHDRMYRFMESEEQVVHAQAERLQTLGLSDYLEKNSKSV